MLICECDKCGDGWSNPRACGSPHENMGWGGGSVQEIESCRMSRGESGEGGRLLMNGGS